MTTEIIETSPKRRDKLIIMAEIIEIAKKGTSKTNIMFKANLSFAQLNQYLSLLSNAGMLKKSSSNEKVIFQSTPKGLEFMERQRQVLDLLSDESSRFLNCVKISTLAFKVPQNKKPFMCSMRGAPRF